MKTLDSVCSCSGFSMEGRGGRARALSTEHPAEARPSVMVPEKMNTRRGNFSFRQPRPFTLSSLTRPRVM